MTRVAVVVLEAHVDRAVGRRSGRRRGRTTRRRSARSGPEAASCWCPGRAARRSRSARAQRPAGRGPRWSSACGGRSPRPSGPHRRPHRRRSRRPVPSETSAYACGTGRVRRRSRRRGRLRRRRGRHPPPARLLPRAAPGRADASVEPTVAGAGVRPAAGPPYPRNRTTVRTARVRSALPTASSASSSRHSAQPARCVPAPVASALVSSPRRRANRSGWLIAIPLRRRVLSSVASRRVPRAARALTVPERDVEPHGDLPLGQVAVVGQLEHLPLVLGQAVQCGAHLGGIGVPLRGLATVLAHECPQRPRRPPPGGADRAASQRPAGGRW